MSSIIILPVVLPLVAAALQILAWRSRLIQRGSAVSSSAALLITALILLKSVWSGGIQAVQVGNWPAPFGITLVADLFSALMVVLAGVMGLAVTVYSLSNIDKQRESFGYYPLLNILLMGVCGAFLTGDLFNLYVWFEVMLIASFVLLTLGGEKEQILGGIKYVTLNLLSSAIFLAAVGLLYGAAGTLNMADLSIKLRAMQQPGFVTVLSVLFLIAFGIKAAIFPLFFWLPASYHTPPVAVSAIFAGLLTKVGVYALFRVFTLIFTYDQPFTQSLFMLISISTMVIGVLGAVAQNGFRRVLSFHIISQIGYMVMGLAIYTPLAMAGAVFYIAHHIIVKANLFLISGIVKHFQHTEELKKLGGLYLTQPWLAILFLIPALSLAGIPPLSGFFAKLMLIQASLGVGQYTLVAVAIGVSFLTLFSMTKIWNEAFWKPMPLSTEGIKAGIAGSLLAGNRLALVLPVAGLATLTLLIGFGAHFLFILSTETAKQLMDPAGYIQAVLGS